MAASTSRIFFDRRDTDILQLVNRVLRGRAQTSEAPMDPSLHPHGIKELVDTPAARMAFAVVNLLHNLETGRTQAADRLLGLRVLYDEVINSAHTTLRRNTARVLMQIMKGIVRAYGNEEAQLRLAHDFRAAAQGTPRIVRRLLRRYCLPEMSEEWNQISFDDHVYDMNTKGRKSPTHLIMDAWIKGMRSLTVVYDNCVDREVAREVLRAARIVGITVRIGVEFRVPFRDRFVNFVWIPRGFSSDDDFLSFLTSHKMTQLTAKGREVVAWIRDQVLRELDVWNVNLRPYYAELYDITIPPVGADDFLNYVARGHANRERLAEYLYTMLQPQVEERLEDLATKEQKESLSREEIRLRNMLENLCADTILCEWLNPEVHAELPGVRLPADLHRLPPLMAMTPYELMKELKTVNGGYRMVLQTSYLSVRDVMELLWDCKGVISHLELFNMRSWLDGGAADIHAIGELQYALNSGQGPRLKQMIRQMISGMRDEGDDERATKFEDILANVPSLWERYRNVPLKSRIGTGASNRTRSFGMGLVVEDTLPRKSAKFLRETEGSKADIPIHATVEKHTIYREPENPSLWCCFLSLFRAVPGCENWGKEKTNEWVSPKGTMRVSPHGNLVNLSGPVTPSPWSAKNEGTPGLLYLNSGLTNVLKVLLGFIPAFFSFLYTQEWWFLAWFGTFIWFGITGVRNVVQMVLAAKGFSRSSLVHWRDHVSLNRLCDSLMYTGISVLLLELLVRLLFLERLVGVTAADRPLLVFTVINLVNSLYIFSHNVYRGLPRTAAVGNLFRALLAIPVAALYNSALWGLMSQLSVADPSFYLVPSATIISKCASDTVAALIEGFADSNVNIRMRRTDYAAKLRSVFDCYTRLELMFPKEDMLNRLARPGGLKGRGGADAQKLERTFVVNALDMMYMWYYQPRAQEAFRHMVRSLTHADRTVLALSQLVLMREREVSQLMVDGLVGANFARPLAFFLSKRREYIKAIVHLCKPGRLHEPISHRAVFGSGD